MTGIVGNKWSFDDFHRRVGGLMRTPLEELVAQIAKGTLHLQVGRVFRLDEIVEAHRCMEENKAGGNIVVLT
jgi:NADPH:quinone reductase-like Zn-dependent oxidoreductase